MADLTYVFSDYYSQVSDFLATGSSPSGTALTDAKAIVNRAYRRFLFPVDLRNGKQHTWSWLTQARTLQTESGKWQYALPVDFARIVDYPKFGDATGYAPLVKRSRDQILQARTDSVGSMYPWYFAVVPAPPTEQLATSWEFWLYPTPGGVYTLKYSYLVNPVKLDAAADVPITGSIAGGEAFMEMCLAVAEQQEDDTAGLHTQLAGDLLQQCIVSDTVATSDTVGTLGQTASISDRMEMHRQVWTAIDLDNVYA